MVKSGNRGIITASEPQNRNWASATCRAILAVCVALLALPSLALAATVPNLYGLSQGAATAALATAGLTLGTVTKVTGPTNLFNEVENQTPAAGSGVDNGSTVAVTISIGSATNPNQLLTSAPVQLTPGQASLESAIQNVCSVLKGNRPAAGTPQANLFSNCSAIVNSYGGGANPAALQQALNAVSGRQTTGQSTMGVQFAGIQFANIASRLSQLRGGDEGPAIAGLDLGLPAGVGLQQLLTVAGHALGLPAGLVGGNSGDSSGDSSGSERVGLSRLGFFVNGNLRRGSLDTTLNETGFDFRSSGLTAGMDYRLTNKFVAGIAVGHSNSDSNAVDDSAHLDSKDTTGSLYASYYDQALYVDMIASFGHISYGEQRTTTYTVNPALLAVGTPTNCTGDICSLSLYGSTGARQFALGTDAGYAFNFGPVDLTPDVAIDYTRVNISSFAEQDPDSSGMAIAYGEQVGDSLLLKIGGQVAYAISTPFGIILPNVRAHYIHEFLDDSRGLLAHYVDDPTVNSSTGPISNFTIFTDEPERNYLDYGVGVTLQFAFGLAAYVEYGALAQDANIHENETSIGFRFQPITN